MRRQCSGLSQMRTARWALWVGSIFALAAVIAAPLAGVRLAGAFNVDGQVSWFSLILGVFLTGSLVWWLLSRRGAEFPIWRGGVAGIFVAILSYPVVIVISQFLHRDWSLVLTPTVGVQQLLSALVIALVSLVSTGWAATIVMAAAGMLAAALPARAARRVASEAGTAPRARTAIDWVLWLGTAVALGGVGLLVFAFVWLSLIPLDTRQLVRHVDANTPAASYDEAMARFGAVQAAEAKLPLNPVCRSSLQTHGQKAAKAVIFFHGLTNCPAQGIELGGELFAQGYNVYMPRLPGHGMADVLTHALSDLTAEQMIDTGDQAIDLAHGLGDEVLVFGLSAGGTLATWAAQTRADTANVVPISPFLGAYAIPTWATRPATNLLLLLPNFMIWWDSTQSEPAGMDYAYPRFATHGLAQMIRLGAAVEQMAEGKAPAAAKIGLLLNAADTAVNNQLTDTLSATWQKHGAVIDTVVLPEADGLPHDVIDPHQPLVNTKVVYPIILGLLAGETEAPSTAP